MLTKETAGEQKSHAAPSGPVIAIRAETAEPKRDATPAPESSDGRVCPKCGSRLVEIAANILRCQQWGYQERFEKKRTSVPPIIVKPDVTAPSPSPSSATPPTL